LVLLTENTDSLQINKGLRILKNNKENFSWWFFNFWALPKGSQSYCYNLSWPQFKSNSKTWTLFLAHGQIIFFPSGGHKNRKYRLLLIMEHMAWKVQTYQQILGTKLFLN